jgi:hypothetical protein
MSNAGNLWAVGFDEAERAAQVRDGITKRACGELTRFCGGESPQAGRLIDQDGGRILRIRLILPPVRTDIFSKSTSTRQRHACV